MENTDCGLFNLLEFLIPSAKENLLNFDAIYMYCGSYTLYMWVKWHFVNLSNNGPQNYMLMSDLTCELKELLQCTFEHRLHCIRY